MQVAQFKKKNSISLATALKSTIKMLLLLWSQEKLKLHEGKMLHIS